MAVGTSAASETRIQGTLSVETVDGRYLICQLIDVRMITLVNGTDERISDPTKAAVELGAKFHIALDGAGSVASLRYPNGMNATRWVVNYHKGLASLFNLRFPQRPDDVFHPAAYSFMQAEVTGKCENAYDWTPVPGPMLKGHIVDFCPEGQNTSGYQLLKTRNFDRCAQLLAYNVMAPSGWRCSPVSAVCENAQSRSLVEKIDLCGDLKSGSIEILNIESREDWISPRWGAKQQPYNKMEIMQKLKLTDKRSGVAKSKPELGVSYSLIFTATAEAAEADMLDDSTTDNELTWLLDKIKELHRIVFQPPELIRRRTSTLRKELLARFRSLSPAMLGTVTNKAYQELSHQEWSLYIQHVAAVGSAASLDALKLLIHEKRVTSRDAVGIVSGFSMYLREPSDHVLAQLLSLLDEDMVRVDARLRQTAMVSLASFFRTACIDRLAAAARFPLAWPFTVTSRKPADYWPTRLVSRLAVEIELGNSADRSAALSALNIIGHASLIPVVVPLVEGKIDDNPALRTKAVLALHKLSHHGNEDAIRILHLVFANPSENYQVRMGAFTLLMLSNPPDHVWQGVAVRTWFEPRIQVASFVYTTFETLASFNSPLRFLQQLSQQAKKVLPLTRPISPRRSANFIWSHEERRRLLASYLRLETFANKASEFPKEIYGRLNVNLGAIDFDLLEFEMHGHHVESLLAEMLGHEASQRARCRDIMSAPVDVLLHRLNVTYHAEDPSEGYVHWAITESSENFWSFDIRDAQIIAAFLESGDILIGEKIKWYHEWPIVNVELRWPNSMGFLNEVVVTGRITATLNGSIRSMNRVPLLLDTQLRPTVALAIESEFGVRSRLSDLRVNSSVLLLGSLPGRASVRLERQLEFQWTSGVAGADVDDESNEMIFFHKSECTGYGPCPAPVDHQTWGAERAFTNGQTPDWNEILSVLSFAWLPESIPDAEPRQWSLIRSPVAPFTFQLTLHLDVNETIPIGWIMKSGTSELRWPTSSLTTRQDRLGRSSAEPLNVAGVDFSGSSSASLDFLEIAAARAAVKPIGSSAGSSGPSLPPSTPQLELPAQMAWVMPTLARALKRQHLALGAISLEQQSSMDLASSGRLALSWTSPERSGSCVTTFAPPPIAPSYFGECLIGSTVVQTFDDVQYEPQLRDGCQYLVAAATGRDDKFAILLEREYRNRNKELTIVLSGDVIAVNVTGMMVVVNNVKVPLEPGLGQQVSQGFLLTDECFGSMLLARKILSDDGYQARLVIELQFHGVVLDISSTNDVIIKAKESLRGRLQGLCGDMNEEKLFEFRGPQRCVLPSGAMMASQYQTSLAPHCQMHTFPPAAGAGSPGHQFQHQADSCPRQEGSPTIIRYPSPTRSAFISPPIDGSGQQNN